VKFCSGTAECMEVYLHSRMLSWYSVCGIKEEILSLPVLWCRYSSLAD